MTSLLIVLAAFASAAWLTRSFADPASRLHLLDHPNERSLHTRPTPRTGGVAIVIGVFVGGIALSLGAIDGIPREAFWLGGSAAVLALVSFVDDRRHVPVVYRLGAHAVAAGLLVLSGLLVKSVPLPGFGGDLPVWVCALATVLFVVWMINLYNFMDGMDGFAGGMAVFGFGAFATLGGMAGNEVFAVLNMVVVAAAAGFLVFNFPPARIFMGDTGSSTLGFLAAGMALWADRSGIAPLWVSVIVFLPFISDATVTLIRRVLRGDRVWEAHRTHFYQRLVRLGWGHRRTVLVEYGLMALCAVAALTAVGATERLQWATLVAVLLLHAGFFGWVRWLEARAMRGVGPL
jgi:UDP-N-acetylmuramyl pentapeptide phosphotransferase/UDP-N-acetylglucosamine-1-phosphate transferase